MKQSKSYPNIDMVKTGLQLKHYMDCAGMSVKDLQEQLQLSCPQPIYRWIRGKILPSVDHLLMLSELFGVHMEELLVKKKEKVAPVIRINEEYSFQKRIIAYFKMFATKVAREKGSPFEINVDPFYSLENIERLKKAASEMV